MHFSQLWGQRGLNRQPGFGSMGLETSPMITFLSRSLPFSVGSGTALMDIYLVLCVVWGLVVITGGSLSVLNDTVMSGSLYYKVFNLFNPFL